MCKCRRTAKSRRWIRGQPAPATSQFPSDLARARRCLHRSMDGGGRSAGDMEIVIKTLAKLDAAPKLTPDPPLPKTPRATRGGKPARR